jgi:ribosomal protein S12 methylthiotransferase
MKKEKINLVTLGCSKNTVDSEHLAAQLEAAGQAVVFDSNDPAARTVIVNTCGFIGDAKEESVETILDFVRAKEAGMIDRIFVAGCLAQRYRDELTAEIPEVDAFFVVNDWPALAAAAGGAWDPALAVVRRLSTPGHYAYLKISEGCDRACGYCAIPLIRGRHVSVPMEELLTEAGLLARKGVKELIVIAQDTTYYGLDRYGERKLAELLRRLCRVEGVEWIRLHYTYPAGFPDEVIHAMRDEPKICKYLDIPFQHISDRQLKGMRRGHTRAETLALIERLRVEIPGIALRTTLLTGYPGESEADFAELLDFVKDVRFERLGVFPYCEEEGTHSALKLRDDVPAEEKERRAERIMAIQSEISLENNLRRVGTEETAIVDRIENDLCVGRTQYDSPEVDQEVFITPTDGTPLAPGDFCRVRITAAEEFDLYAETIK